MVDDGDVVAGVVAFVVADAGCSALLARVRAALLASPAPPDQDQSVRRGSDDELFLPQLPSNAGDEAVNGDERFRLPALRAKSLANLLLDVPTLHSNASLIFSSRKS